MCTVHKNGSLLMLDSKCYILIKYCFFVGGGLVEESKHNNSKLQKM